MEKKIIGAKGSDESQHTPVEAPDSLSSTAQARILDLVSEGEIYGLEDGLKSVYLDRTPLQNDDLTFNFKNVQVDFRVGTQDQDHIPGFPAVESETGVGIELTDTIPWIHAFTNLQLSAMRVLITVPALSKTNTENGDVNGYRIEYAIDVATDGGSYIEVFHSSFAGKTTDAYQRSHRIDFPKATSTGWLVRVRRITPNLNSAYAQDTTVISSYTEVIDGKFRYPNSAVVGISIDSSQFNAIPQRSYKMRGRIIRVPSNYNPETRVYTGVWDGLFALAWTNNPAWIYYDMLTSFRYGLGDRLDELIIDKWTLYAIGQYCDELVPDGKGGMEPRFACSCYLQTREDAVRVLQQLASVFRGISFYTEGLVLASADMPGDPAFTYTNANVIDGKFVYSGTARRARHTVCIVSWNDPDNFGTLVPEYVEDEDGIARYGVQEISITAFGCFSQGQAFRTGKWLLATERLETDAVTFGVGMDGTFVLPGKVVQVADSLRAGRRTGGRIKSYYESAVPVSGFVLDELMEVIFDESGVPIFTE